MKTPRLTRTRKAHEHRISPTVADSYRCNLLVSSCRYRRPLLTRERVHSQSCGTPSLRARARILASACLALSPLLHPAAAMPTLEQFRRAAPSFLDPAPSTEVVITNVGDHCFVPAASHYSESPAIPFNCNSSAICAGLPDFYRCDGSWLPMRFAFAWNPSPEPWAVDHSFVTYRIDRSGTYSASLRYDREESAPHYSGPSRREWRFSVNLASLRGDFYRSESSSIHRIGTAECGPFDFVENVRKEWSFTDALIGFPFEPNGSWQVPSCPSYYDLALIPESALPPGQRRYPTVDAVISASAGPDARAIAADPQAFGYLVFRTSSPEIVAVSSEPWPILHSFGPGHDLILAEDGWVSAIEVTPVNRGDEYFAVLLVRGLPLDTSAQDIRAGLELELAHGTQPPVRVLFGLNRPPVVLVHGLWSNANAWGSFDRWLMGSYPAASSERTDYRDHNDKSYASEAVQAGFWQSLLAARSAAEKAGVISSRVDVVGHSMGGLVSRAFRDNEDSLVPSRIARLITVGTPHLGSPLASWLFDHRDQAPDAIGFLGSILLERWLGSIVSLKALMAGLNQGIEGGAIEALDSIESLDGGQYFAVAGHAPDFTGAEAALNLVAMLFDGKPFAFRDTLDSILEPEPPGVGHDTIVPLLSQLGNAAESIVLENLIHAYVPPGLETWPFDPSGIETTDPCVFEEIRCLLESQNACAAPPMACPPLGAAMPFIGSSEEVLLTDLSTWSERSPAVLQLDVEPSTGLSAGEEGHLVFSSSEGQLTRVVALTERGAFLALDPGALAAGILPPTLEDIQIHAIGLFDDNSYAAADFVIPVTDPGAPEALTCPTSLHLAPGRCAQLAILAAYPGALVDVTQSGEVLLAVSPDGAATTHEGGVVCGLRFGGAIVSAAFRGALCETALTLVGSEIFADSLEAGDLRAWSP